MEVPPVILRSFGSGPRATRLSTDIYKKPRKIGKIGKVRHIVQNRQSRQSRVSIGNPALVGWAVRSLMRVRCCLKMAIGMRDKEPRRHLGQLGQLSRDARTPGQLDSWTAGQPDSWTVWRCVTGWRNLKVFF